MYRKIYSHANSIRVLMMMMMTCRIPHNALQYVLISKPTTLPRLNVHTNVGVDDFTSFESVQERVTLLAIFL